MIEFVHAFIASLGTSDVCSGWPGLLNYSGIQAAHVLVGAFLGLTCLPFRVFFFLGWLAKETFSDLPSCGWDWFVALDSIADLLLAGLGAALALSLKREKAARKPDAINWIEQ